MADDTLTHLLQSHGSEAVVLVQFERAVNIALLKTLSGVKEVETLEDNRYRVIAEGKVDLRPELFRFAADSNLSLLGLKQEENSLETIFRDLTQEKADIS